MTATSLCGQRIINYLGSKFRIVDQISDVIGQCIGPKASVCDLFSGAGSTAHYLSYTYKVIAADIQEYSRVICSSLLTPCPSLDADRIIEASRNSELRHRLHEIYQDIVQAERAAISQSLNGNHHPLRDFCMVGGTQGALDERWGQGNALVNTFRRCAESIDRASSVEDLAITRFYGGVYFSVEQSIDLDALLHLIHRMKPRSGRDHLLASVMATASTMVNSIGKQFAQPTRIYRNDDSVKPALALRMANERSRSVFSDLSEQIAKITSIPRYPGQHLALARDYRDVLSDQDLRFDAIYADPPYTREHYSRFYHILETMAKHDNPSYSTTKIRSKLGSRVSRGVYRLDRHQSPFCIKSQAPTAFRDLFSGGAARGIPVVLSYSPHVSANGDRPRLLSVDQITAIARDYYQQVDCVDVHGMSHNKFNQVERNLTVSHCAEVVVVCQS